MSTQISGNKKIKLGFSGVVGILRPYIRSRFLEQLKSVWVIIAYLILFQILVLQLPIVYSLTIALGVLIVIIGLMFFLEGLMLGLMPLGELLGTKLPVKSSLPVILIFAFILGVGATFAEPAIAVLKSAGSGVDPGKAPLLYSLLNEFSGQLVMAVGAGVGIAVLLGVLRFMRGWSLKVLIMPVVIVLIAFTLFAHANEVLNPIIGLAWDCGAVTTGPVTVPLVIALGIGVSLIVNTGNSSSSAFGIVTLASLFPVLAVMLLGTFHYAADDYYGAKNAKPSQVVVAQATANSRDSLKNTSGIFTETDLQQFHATGTIPGDYKIDYKSDSTKLVDGKIVAINPTVVYTKKPSDVLSEKIRSWATGYNWGELISKSLADALRAIVPLSLFLFIMMRFVVREKIPRSDEILFGIFLAVIGFAIFGIGLFLGLTSLGTQLGSNIPSAFTRVQLWELESSYGPLFKETSGKIVAIVFGFFLGYGATLAEPALNALGITVEKITVGSFKKSLLMQTVAIGVGLGIAMGVCKIAYNIPLTYLLIPPYILLLGLTLLSTEEFTNFGWDSAGVTTGPITVPLVLAMGLGIGSNIPGVIDGFGVLALASAMPIISVLAVGLFVNKAKPTGDV
ncbi:MAG TPA: DUF1538 domain-containing protein [Flavitalea sp.]|nr:DUF1538 domain-containing protein [Flavitalea sp.]